MKFYETNFEEYIYSVEKHNLHPEIKYLDHLVPRSLQDFDNLIVYGATGIGKYSQVLMLLKRYSTTELKYQTKIRVESEKTSYICLISDIHYEVDMALLGCNSKIIWNEIFQQILDIISMTPIKIGIIVCKNFHMIHSELLEIFYSYIQQFNNPYLKIQIKFILITEHISFIPNNILNICETLSVKRPTKDKIIECFGSAGRRTNIFSVKIQDYKNVGSKPNIIKEIEMDTVINMKELRSFSLIHNPSDIPLDIFNTICNNVISDIKNHKELDFTKFRDSIYDILVYNLDVAECVWYIMSHFIQNRFLLASDISDIIKKTHNFLKYYNNNYRPIYHLEAIMFDIIIRVSKKDGQMESLSNIRNKGSKSKSGPNKEILSVVSA